VHREGFDLKTPAFEKVKTGDRQCYLNQGTLCLPFDNFRLDNFVPGYQLLNNTIKEFGVTSELLVALSLSRRIYCESNNFDPHTLLVSDSFRLLVHMLPTIHESDNVCTQPWARQFSHKENSSTKAGSASCPICVFLACCCVFFPSVLRLSWIYVPQTLLYWKWGICMKYF
jgi:hypothetical protein